MGLGKPGPLVVEGLERPPFQVDVPGGAVLAVSRHEGGDERPGLAGSAKRVPRDVVGPHAPAQEARGDELLDGQSVSVVADGEGPGDSGRVLALRDDRVGEGRHAGGGQRGQFAHLVHGHTLADVGLYLAGAHLPVRLGGVGGLAVAAERRAQGVRDGQNVPVAFRVIERKLFAVGLEPEKLEFFHGSPR